MALLKKTVDSVPSGTEVKNSAIISRDAEAQRKKARTVAKQQQAAERIAAATSELATGITEASSAAEELKRAADQIATGAEEASSAAQESLSAFQLVSKNIARQLDNANASQVKSDATQSLIAKTSAEVNSLITNVGLAAQRQAASVQMVAELEKQAANIGNIVQAVGRIADQTNLLALNAAIEAARAGEMGRGFAVVADEVRSLAVRTTAATHEIGDLIKGIQKETSGAVATMEEGVREVEIGTEKAAKSGSALQDILSQINEVFQQMNQIATAAEQQTGTTNEISSKMLQITDVIQATAGGARESASGAASLAKFADDLQHLVRQFKLAA